MSSEASPRLTGPERRAQILAAAREEFLERGFAGARVQSVAVAAGVTNALIYKHFPSKEALFEEAVMAPVHDLLTERIEHLRSLPEDPAGKAQRDSTREFIRALLRMFVESVDALGVILFGERRHARRFYTEQVRPLIDASIEASRVNSERWPHRDFDFDTAVTAAFGMAFWLALDRSMRDVDEDLDAQADELVALLFDGISTT